MIVAENFGLGLYNNSLFLFCGSRNDRFKTLYWDNEGFILLYKKENFHFLGQTFTQLVSDQAIHNDISTTMNTYAYLIDEYKDKSDKAFF